MAKARDKDAEKPQDSRREYVVVARRYRPQTFEELVGQQHVAKALAAAIETSRVGHAYLFTGARGTGKTSTARILAKALNCERGPTATPCNECDICRSITAGDDMDVLEIDGASNRGIDEIRQLRQNVNVRPSRSRFKVYIIDEVHMLTEPAFNALLKTLEEPPEHVKFIFCTTEPEKIPITILSRCQRFDFAGVQTPQIVERLRQIVEAEGVQAEPEALEILARRAAGSMRDSQSLLEQLLAIASGKITVADVHALLGSAGAERIGRLVSALVERDAGAALAELDRAVAEGVDSSQLLDQLLGYFRDIMATAAGCPASALLNVSSSEQPAIKEAAEKLGLETVLAVLLILDQTISKLRFLTYPRTLAELALVRICRLDDLESLPALIAQLREGSTAAAPGASAKIPSRTPPPAPKKNDEVKPAPAAMVGDGNGHAAITAPHAAFNGGTAAAGGGATQSVGEQYVPTSRRAGMGPSGEADAGFAESQESAIGLWKQAAERLGGLAAEMAQQAHEATIRAPDQLVVQFSSKYNACKLFCERPEVVSRLSTILAEIAGRPMAVAFESMQDAPAEDAAPARATTARQRLYEACQRPFVRKALELFDATAERLEEARS